MTAKDDNSVDALPLTDRRKINAICVEFEQAWVEGHHPRVEAFAARMSGRAGKALLAELLAQDIDLRMADGQIVGPEQYYDRFTNAAPEIEAAFTLIRTREESSFLDDPTVERGDADNQPEPSPNAVVVKPGSAQHREFAQIVVRLMQNIKDGGQYELEKLADEYPEHADELRLLHPGMQLLADLSSDSGREFGPGVTGTLGDYHLGREIGRGGMGVVYEARQISLDKRVAVKVLPFASVLDSRRLQRFLNEARAAAQLQHDHIVPVYAVGCDRGVHYYAMRLIEGNNLAEVIHDLRSLTNSSGKQRLSTENVRQDETMTHDPDTSSQPTVKNVSSRVDDTSSQIVAHLSTKRSANSSEYFLALAGLGIQAADALQHAHDMGVVHRDVKPSNLMLDREGQLWITDFGLAQVQDTTEVTVSGDFVGTLRYMSPEQALAKRVVVDHRTDIYSLGVTLYELVTTERAFDGDTRAEVLKKIAFGAPALPRKINRQIPAELETIILKALSKNPDERYQTARDLADDLRSLRNHRPIVARPPNIAQRIEKWLRRNPAYAKMIGVAVVMIVVVSTLAALAGWGEFAIEQRRRTRLQRALLRSEGSRLTANSRLELENDPGLALLLAVEGASRFSSRAANNALLSALDSTHEYRTLTNQSRHGGQARFSPNGHFIISTAGHPGTLSGIQPARVWDAHTGQLLRTLEDRTWISSAVISPDGARVLTTTNPFPAWHPRHLGEDARGKRPPCIWDALTGRKVLTLRDARLPEAHPECFSPDGLKLVTPAGGNNARIWDTISGRPLKTLQGHPGRVVFAAFSRDGRRVATIGEDKTVRVWNAEDGTSINTITWPSETDDQPWSVSFSPDGRWVLTSFDDWGPQVWDIDSGRRVNPGRWNGSHAIFTADGTRVITYHTGSKVVEINDVVSGKRGMALEGHLDTIDAISLSPDGGMVLTASSDKTARLWDVDTGAELAILRGHTGGLNGATFSPDSQRVVTASSDRTVRIWNVKSGRLRSSLADDAVSMPHPWATYGPQGKHILVLTKVTPRCTIWDTATGRPLLDVPGGCNEPAVRSDVLISAWGKTARVWDRLSGKQLAVLSRYVGRVLSAELSKDGEVAVVIGEDGPSYIWHWKTGRRIVLHDQEGQVHASTISPDGKTVAIGASDGRVSIWNLRDGNLESVFLHRGAVWQTRFSSDGRRLLTVTDRNIARIWDVATMQETVSMSAPGSRMNDGHWNAEGTHIVTFHTHRNDAVRVWDARSGELLGTLAEMPGPTRAVFDVLGNRIAVASMAKGLILWDCAANRRDVISASPFRSVAFSPDGKRLAAATSVPGEDPVRNPQNQRDLEQQPPSLFVWETATQELVRTIQLQGFDAYYLRFLADGEQIFVGVRSYGAKIFDQHQGEEKSRIIGHSAPIYYAAFSPDGRQVLTASWDGTASLWDVQTGRRIRTLAGHKKAVLHAAFSPQNIATASADGTCIVWNRQTGKPAATLAGHTDQVGFVAFSPDHNRLLTLSRDRSMRLWTPEGRQLDQKKLDDRLFIGAQFQPKGAGLLVVPGLEARDRKPADQRDGQPGFNVRIYRDFNGDRFGEEFLQLPHARSPVMGRFGPQGNRVITVDFDGAAYIWNARTGTKLRTFSRDDQSIQMAMFDPTGDLILTANRDYISLRSSETGAELMTIREEHPLLTRPTYVWPVPQRYQPFSPDGRWLVTVGLRGHVRQWPVHPLDIARDYTARDLTQDEIEHFEIRQEE